MERELETRGLVWMICFLLNTEDTQLIPDGPNLGSLTYSLGERVSHELDVATTIPNAVSLKIAYSWRRNA